MKIRHLAIRWKDISLCGICTHYGLIWADSVKAVKENPDYKGIKFCKTCLRLMKKKRVKQLTVEECKKV